MLISSHSETLLQNWIEQTSSGFFFPFASPVFVLGPAVLQLSASALSSSCSLLPSWRHQWFHRCWDVICLPIFSALNANLQHGCWCMAPQSWSSLWLAARKMYDKKTFDSMRTLGWHELISRKFELISGELISWELISSSRSILSKSTLKRSILPRST